MPLDLVIKAKELFNDDTQTFITLDKDQPLKLEHSLVSISKWEAKYHKPFIPADENEKKTLEELKYYVKCMTITQNVDPKVYDALTNEDYKQITDYIADKHTATFFGDELEDGNGSSSMKSKKKIVTSELIYYWMISLQIDIKCEKWHLNRLLTLIKVCQKKNEAQSKSGKSKGFDRNLAQRYAAINASRMHKPGK